MECSFGRVSLADLRLVVFDLDGTLAPSKSSMPQTIAREFEKLLSRFEVAIMSGGQLSQFQTQILSTIRLRKDSQTLHFLPTCGTQHYLVDRRGQIRQLYLHKLKESDRTEAKRTLETVAKELGYWETNPWGEIIEDRQTQITFSALGQKAPLEAKRNWDPGGEKKRKLVARTQPRLPRLSVRAGGSTSVDVTAKGIDKAYGMRALLTQTGFSPAQVIFIGDRFNPEGNDYPVVSTGVACQAVTDWQDTLNLMQKLLTV